MTSSDDRDGMKWSVTGSRHLYRDRWISVRADDCVTPSGAVLKPFYVLEYSDWVHVVALDRDGHILLVRQYRHGFGATSLELPGGMMDATEFDPIAAGMRELAEETGYVGADSHLVASLSPNPATHSNRLHVVLARDVEPGAGASPEPTENLLLERLPVDEAIRVALTGGMVHSGHVGLLFVGLGAAGLL